MAAPELIKPIPAQAVNELAAYGPFNLSDYIKAPDNDPTLRFQAELKNGAALPNGLICTSDGFITGIPSKGTEGNYEILIHAQTESGTLTAEFVMMVKAGFAENAESSMDKIKAQIWEALEKKLPVPDLEAIYSREITAVDIYYLIERWGIITIWDAYNLDPPSDKILLTLDGVSPHYDIYDRGSSIIGCPKDLFSFERTLADGLQTARVMAREVYKRNWSIEMAGLDKLMRAAWVELQRLGDQYGKRLEIINYNPSPHDVMLYSQVSRAPRPE